MVIKKCVLGLILTVVALAASYGRQLTPLEQSGYSNLTSHADMLTYLQHLDASSGTMKMEIIGQSVQNRAIPVLFFTVDKSFGSKREQKPIVLVFCQQHGNEPSGKEAALIVARDLSANKKSLLENMDIILMPQVNPDGAEMGQRTNANRMDLNRNHVILSEPETQALHQLFLKWLPEVTLDVHEYSTISKDWVANGFIRDADEMLGGVTNLNIAPELIQFTREIFMPEVAKSLRDRGFSFHRYIVGSPFPNQRVRFSTTAINDGRQSLGIYNTLSFILEGKRYADLTTQIERRTEGQVAAIMAFLEIVARRQADILPLIKSAREKLAQNATDSWVHLQMDYFPDSTQKTLSFPVFDLYSWKPVNRQLEKFEPLVKVKKSVRRPFAYVFSANEARLIEILQRHQIPIMRLKQPRELTLESYRILHVTSIMEEERSVPHVDVDIQLEKILVDSDSRIVWVKGPHANLLPLMLEPQSSWGVVTESGGDKYRFQEYLHEGKVYPIFRLVQPVELDLDVVPIN